MNYCRNKLKNGNEHLKVHDNFNLRTVEFQCTDCSLCSTDLDVFFFLSCQVRDI